MWATRAEMKSNIQTLLRFKQKTAKCLANAIFFKEGHWVTYETAWIGDKSNECLHEASDDNGVRLVISTVKPY